jgi:hypothetical protein
MIIGADYYESEEQRSALFAAGRIPIGIGQVGRTESAPPSWTCSGVSCANWQPACAWSAVADPFDLPPLLLEGAACA